MEFVGFSGSADTTVPIDGLVRASTDSMLLGPDWSVNMELCDAISNTVNGADIAVQSLVRRMKDSNQQSVYLAMMVVESCMKNCSKFAPAVQKQKPFMDEMVQIAKGTRGSKAQEEALRLIKQWQQMFSKNRGELPIFNEAFQYLRERGVTFPAVDEVVPPPADTAASTEMTQQQLSQKLKNDLKTVLEKVRLCREMLPNSSGIATDVALAEVIGYLEACRTRLMELIEAGVMGMLEEDLLELCLKTQDTVNKTLEAEMSGTPITSTDDIDAVFSDEKNAPTSKVKADGVSAVQAVAFSIEDDDGGLDVKMSNKGKKKSAPVDASAPKFKINPPSSSASSKAAATSAATPASSGEIDILGLSSPSNSGQVAAKPVAANDLDLLFMSPTPAAPAPTTSAPASVPGGVTSMSDDDFESFLNNLTPAEKK